MDPVELVGRYSLCVSIFAAILWALMVLPMELRHRARMRAKRREAEDFFRQAAEDRARMDATIARLKAQRALREATLREEDPLD